jgi:hypothetical protein
MNLAYAYKLLVAADEQRHGFLKLHGRHADHELRYMSDAGLVDATLSDGNEESFASINRVTAFGHAFLRTFRDQSIPDPARLVRTKGVSGEWNLNP